MLVLNHWRRKAVHFEILTLYTIFLHRSISLALFVLLCFACFFFHNIYVAYRIRFFCFVTLVLAYSVRSLFSILWGKIIERSFSVLVLGRIPTSLLWLNGWRFLRCILNTVSALLSMMTMSDKRRGCCCPLMTVGLDFWGSRSFFWLVFWNLYSGRASILLFLFSISSSESLWESKSLSSAATISSFQQDVSLRMLSCGRSDIIPQALAMLGSKNINDINAQVGRTSSL